MIQASAKCLKFETQCSEAQTPFGLYLCTCLSVQTLSVSDKLLKGADGDILQQAITQRSDVVI